MGNTQNSPSSKMFPDSSPLVKEKTFAPCSKRLSPSAMIPFLFLNLQKENGCEPERSWEIISPSHGAFRERNTGACPKEEIVSTLSQILQANVPEKYYLSSRACEGILRRAQRRDKELPPMLRKALEETMTFSMDQG